MKNKLPKGLTYQACIVDCKQRDQIGIKLLSLKGPGDNFSYNCSPNTWAIYKYGTLQVKCAVVTFWAFLGKIGLLLIAASDHTDCKLVLGTLGR